MPHLAENPMKIKWLVSTRRLCKTIELNEGNFSSKGTRYPTKRHVGSTMFTATSNLVTRVRLP